jgi:hypothetical protein
MEFFLLFFLRNWGEFVAQALKVTSRRLSSGSNLNAIWAMLVDSGQIPEDRELRQALRQVIGQARKKEMGRHKRVRSNPNSTETSPAKDNKKLRPESPQPETSSRTKDRPKSPNSLFLESIASLNRFSSINTSEKVIEEEREDVVKPPPIVFTNTKYLVLVKLLKTVHPGSKFVLKTRQKNDTAVHLETSEDYRKAVKACRYRNDSTGY